MVVQVVQCPSMAVRVVAMRHSVRIWLPARQHSLCQSLWGGEAGSHERAVAEYGVVMAVTLMHLLGTA